MGRRDPERHFHVDDSLLGLGRRVAQSGVLALSAQLLKFVISFASTVILARLLTPEDYGLVAMIAVVYGFLTLFQYFGLPTAIIQWKTLTHPEVSNLFWITLILSTGVAIILAIIGSLFAVLLGQPDFRDVATAYGFVAVLSGLFSHYRALLIRQMRFGAIAAVEIVALLVGSAGAVAGALYGLHFEALIVNAMLIAAVTLIGLYALCPWRPGLPDRTVSMRPFLAFGMHLSLHNVFGYVSRNLDNLLIGIVWGARQLALYSKAYQLLMLPLEQLNGPLGTAVVPALSRLTDNPERYAGAYLRSLQQLTMIVVPPVVLSIVIADWLTLLVLGPNWDGVAYIFRLLGIAALVQPLTSTSWWLLTTQGRIRELAAWTAVNCGFTVIAVLAGLPWGVTGVAASYGLMDLLVITPLLIAVVTRTGPIRAPQIWSAIQPGLFAGVLVLILALGIRTLVADYSLLLKCALTCAGSAMASAIMYLSLPVSRASIEDLWRLLHAGVRD